MTTCVNKMRNEIDASEELRRGPWTLEEDTLLTHYVARNGEGRWNMVAKSAGLKRTGKSCRLRWLNYLKPDIKRGNLTPQEQLLILELHSKWGNRWSKIAQHLPGRTDNEIKNYWRTRVQKQARKLNIESNSHQFFEAVRSYWMPRLMEKMEQTTSFSSMPSISCSSTHTTNDYVFPDCQSDNVAVCPEIAMSLSQDQMNQLTDSLQIPDHDNSRVKANSVVGSDYTTLPQLVDLSQIRTSPPNSYYNTCYYNDFGYTYEAAFSHPEDNSFSSSPQEFVPAMTATNWMMDDTAMDYTWNMEDIIWQ